MEESSLSIYMHEGNRDLLESETQRRGPYTIKDTKGIDCISISISRDVHICIVYSFMIFNIFAAKSAINRVPNDRVAKGIAALLKFLFVRGSVIWLTIV